MEEFNDIDFSEMTNREIDIFIDNLVDKITGKRNLIMVKIEEIQRQEDMLKLLYDNYHKAILELRERGQINFKIEDNDGK